MFYSFTAGLTAVHAAEHAHAHVSRSWHPEESTNDITDTAHNVRKHFTADSVAWAHSTAAFQEIKEIASYTPGIFRRDV